MGHPKIKIVNNNTQLFYKVITGKLINYNCLRSDTPISFLELHSFRQEL